jgi:hypothetical protein
MGGEESQENKENEEESSDWFADPPYDPETELSKSMSKLGQYIRNVDKQIDTVKAEISAVKEIIRLQEDSVWNDYE